MKRQSKLKRIFVIREQLYQARAKRGRLGMHRQPSEQAMLDKIYEDFKKVNDQINLVEPGNFKSQEDAEKAARKKFDKWVRSIERAKLR